MTIRTSKYNIDYTSSLVTNDGTTNFSNQTRFSYLNKCDIVTQVAFDLVANTEYTLSINLTSLKLLICESIDPVSIALQLSTDTIPSPIYSTPSLYTVLKFSDTVPLFVPSFIKFKSANATSVELVVAGERT